MLYTHLTPFERGMIETLLQAGYSLRGIAKELGRNASTILREVNRNQEARKRYKAVRAQQGAIERRRRSVKPRKLDENPQLREYVEHKLREDWSPEQISGTLCIDFPRQHAMRVSHETIYTHVYADKRTQGTLYEHLRQAHRTRRRRGNYKGKRGLLPGRVGIEKRPKAVEKRREVGHWEADLVLGRQSGPAIVTLVERKLGLLVACKVENRRAYTVSQAIIAALQRVPSKLLKSITFDNGKEFAHFKTIEHALKIRTYFADAYAAWQRGTNENTNGLLRQYFPKKSDFHLLEPRRLNQVVQTLNNRPRKRLNFRTPAELFRRATVALRF